MRLPLVVSVLIAVLPVSAQQPAASKKTEGAPKPKIVAPAPTPAPKRGVLGRIFGKKATPTPAPTPQPQPVVAAKPKPKPRKPRPAPQPAETAPVNATAAAEEAPKPPVGEPANPETQAPAPKPEAGEPAATTTEPPAPKETAKGAKPKAGKNAPKTAEAENLDEAAKYKNARATALEDAQIKELKGKADSAIAEDEAQRTSLAYNKALFRKIRQLDPSIDGYVDKLEQAMMKRLSAEKKAE